VTYTAVLDIRDGTVFFLARAVSCRCDLRGSADIRLAVRAQRAFLARAVEFLVTQSGIRQFLDIGTGLPSANNTHQVAQAGVVQVHRWRAGTGGVGNHRNLAIYAGVARKP
jgi:hypothetical protein